MHKPFKKPIYITRPLLPSLDKYKKLLEQVWDSQWITNNGPKHKKLEKKLRNYLKVPSLSLFNNGTTALITAIQSLKLTGEIITTPFTFPATPHAINWNHLIPVFADIKKNDFTIDPRSIEKHINKKTSAILAVHVFGQPCDVYAIENIAKCYKLKIIYDAAHAFGTEINGIPIGQFGDISMFSFHATKLFNTAEGGALAFNDLRLKKIIELTKNFGIKNEEEVLLPGLNGKMNELQSSLGLLNLEEINEEKSKRQNIYNTYITELKNVTGVSLSELDTKNKNSLQYFVLRINKEKFGISRDDVYRKFKKYNIYTRKYFYPLCSEYNCYKNLPSADKKNLPVANQVVKEILTMPFYGSLKDEEVTKICFILKSFKK